MTSTDQPGGVPPMLDAGPYPELHGSSRWRWWIHFLLLAMYPLVIGGLALVGGGRTEPALTGTVRGLLIVSAVELGVFGLIFLVAWLCSRANREQLLLAAPFRWRMLPLGLAYSIGLRLGVAIIAGVIAGIAVASRAISVERLQDFVASNRPDVEALVDVKALENNVLYMTLNATLVSFVVAGVREELWRAGVLAGMRALWPAKFTTIGGQMAAIAIAAVIFGLGHFAQGVLAAFLTAALGFMLGAIMVLHKSLWPAVLAHGAFNATTFVILPWALKHLPEFAR